MRDAVSQPSLDIEESYFSKSSLFFGKKSHRILLPDVLNPRFLWFLDKNGAFTGKSSAAIFPFFPHPPFLPFPA